MSSNEYPLDDKIYEDSFRRTARICVSEIIDAQGVDHAVNRIATLRILYLFG